MRRLAPFWLLAGVASASGSSSSSLPSDASAFSFDGTTSDIAQQLYWRAQANASADKLTLASVPDAVVTRLSALGIDFNDLPGVVQRAVLWDTGFVVAPSGTQALKIQTIGNYSLTDIAVPYDDFISAECKALKCNSTIYSTSNECNGAQMLSVSRCVIEAFEDAGEAAYSMWTDGADPDMVPEIGVVNHQWTDSGVSYKVYAVHTLSEGDEPVYGECSTTGYGSLVVPCFPSSNTTGVAAADIHDVTPSAWVTTWLKEYQGSDSSSASSSSSEDTDEASGFNLVLLVPIICAVLVLIALLAGLWWWTRRRRQDGRYAGDDHTSDTHTHTNDGSGQNSSQIADEGPYKPISTPDVSAKKAAGYPEEEWRPTDSTEAATLAGYTGTSFDQTIKLPQDMAVTAPINDSGPDRLLRILTTDANLVEKRIPYDQLHFQSTISRGAYGEVWLCEYQGQQVATKRLIVDKQLKFDDIQEFVEEIQLSASLQHPHIVRVLGVAWNTLYNLSMVIDYLPTGDLQLYLRKQGDLMSWARDKIHIAIGIAQALEYLHTRTPPLIHRDLKSKNVLLTRMLDPQLIDFGVSRRRMEETMTAGVGTPYWTAPEVLAGERYTEQTDIYSFGVVLSELDTCHLPYFDAVGPDGTKMKPFQVLDGVMSGVLRPSFTDACPSRIRRLGVACLQQESTRRPTARQLVEILGG